MAVTGLKGPHTLSEQSIDLVVTLKSPGAYALDSGTDASTFYVSYVGRSDVDVNARLKQHVGRFARFKFEYFSSAKTAFEKECTLYHDFNTNNNLIHPARPAGTNYKCPRVGCTELS